MDAKKTICILLYGKKAPQVKWCKRYFPEEDNKKTVLNEAREIREKAERRIDNMIAQVNGCGDRWFLKPISTIDECVEDEEM